MKALCVPAEPSHWLHENSISKTVHHHFWPQLIPTLPTNWGYLFISKLIFKPLSVYRQG